MRSLLKKEFLLSLHPTQVIFPLFALFVFIPNYPYEVMFFFSGLAVFFVCLQSRENGDLAFSCTLPAEKGKIALARILFCLIFEGITLCSAALFTAVKELCFTPEAQLNMAGCDANFAFLGYGIALLGLFNAVFFPLYFKNPQRVGVPFVAAGIAQFAAIALLIVLRFTVPLFGEALSTPDPAFMAEKGAAFAAGTLLGWLLTLFACLYGRKKFLGTDL